MDKYHFLNGKYVSASEAKVDIFDLGLIRGYGIFDFTIAYENRPLQIKEHLKRFEQSAKTINLKLTYSLSKIADTTINLLNKNYYPYSGIRWILTAGLDEFENKPTFAILNYTLEPFPKDCYEKGIKIICADFKRQTPTAKTLNYQYAYSQHQKMKKIDAFELLYVSNNIATECSSSNIFMVKNGTLITPDKDILIGITRADVIKLAKKHGIAISERQIKKSELLSADEVFITASSKNIMPVTKIDNKNIGNGEPGPATKKLIEQYKNPTR